MDKPKELVMVLAEAKADAIISRLQSERTIEWGCSCYTVDYCRVQTRWIIREKLSCKEEAWNFIKAILVVKQQL
ncbi:hypothetical protein FF1_009809 [Malus domestica]